MQAKHSTDRFRHVILVPVCLALVLLLGLATAVAYRLQRLHVVEGVRERVNGARQIARLHLKETADALDGLIELITRDIFLQDAWLRQDRIKIMRIAGPIFGNTFKKQQVTHFYFISPDNVCFLRVHKPDYFGDRITRHTLRMAADSSRPARGLELGPLGTLTLRVVHPWWIDGNLQGFIEMGVEIDNLAPKLKNILDSDLVFTVKKKHLDRRIWEQGVKSAGRPAFWDQLPGVVVMSQTLDKLPTGIERFRAGYRGPPPYQTFSLTHESATRPSKDTVPVFQLAQNGRHYSGGWLPLTDAGGDVIGDLMVLKEITAQQSALRKMLRAMLGVGLLIGLLLSTFFYQLVGRIESRLMASHRELADEIEQRRSAQNELRQANTEMEKRVEKRTVELSRVNRELQQQVFECERAESALRESEEQYSTLVEDALMGVYVVQDGRIQFANQKMAAIFGYRRSELIGMDSVDLIHPTERDRIKRLRDRRLRGESTPAQYETRGTTQNGRTLWIMRSISPIHYQNGTALLGNVVDITARKQAENRLHSSEKEHRLLARKLLTAEENERQRIAREVHDSIGQALSAIKFSLEIGIRKLNRVRPPIDTRQLEAIVPLTQQTIEEVRRLVMDLRPSILDDLGVLATINWFCREFQSIYTGISIRKEITADEGAIASDLKIVIYRVLQEVFNNIAKHSRADTVRFRLRIESAGLVLIVGDNGAGFDLQAVYGLQPHLRGFGLASIKERSELAGGRFKIRSRPGRGTVIRICWPASTGGPRSA